jgi:hypothetical protein
MVQQNAAHIIPVQQHENVILEADQMHMAHPNLTPNTMVHGVPFHAGFHPNSTGLANSPI